MPPRQHATWMPPQQKPDIAPSLIERTLSSAGGASLRQQAESLTSWQSVNGQRALPPLSLVLQAVCDSPQTLNRPRARFIISGLPITAFRSKTSGAPDTAPVNSARAMADVDEGQKAALPPPFRRSQSDTSVQRLSDSVRTSSLKRLISDFDQRSYFEERPRQRSRDSAASSLLEDRSLRPKLLSLSFRRTQQRSNSFVSATPALSSGGSYASPSGGLGTPGSMLMTLGDPFRSPAEARGFGERNDYFSRSHAKVDYHAARAHHITNAAFSAACTARGDAKHSSSNNGSQSHRSRY